MMEADASSLQDRLIDLLADILEQPLTIFAGGPEPEGEPMELRLHTLRPDLSKRAAELLAEAGA